MSSNIAVGDTVDLSFRATALLEQAKSGQVASRMLAKVLSGGEKGEVVEQQTVFTGGQGDFQSVAKDRTTVAERKQTSGTGDEYSEFYDGPLRDSLINLAGEMPDEESKAAFFTALANRTLSIQHAADVSGLNYRVDVTEISSGNEVTGHTYTTRYNADAIPDKTRALIGGAEKFGGFLVSW